jgi:hypothetical protein
MENAVGFDLDNLKVNVQNTVDDKGNYLNSTLNFSNKKGQLIGSIKNIHSSFLGQLKNASEVTPDNLEYITREESGTTFPPFDQSSNSITSNNPKNKYTMTAIGASISSRAAFFSKSEYNIGQYKGFMGAMSYYLKNYFRVNTGKVLIQRNLSLNLANDTAVKIKSELYNKFLLKIGLDEETIRDADFENNMGDYQIR